MPIGDINVMSSHNFDGGRVSVYLEYEVTAVDAEGEVTATKPLRWAVIDERAAGATSTFSTVFEPRPNQLSTNRNKLKWNSLSPAEAGGLNRLPARLEW